MLDGTIAQDGAQAKGIWYIREGITEALKHRGGFSRPACLHAAAPLQDGKVRGRQSTPYAAAH